MNRVFRAITITAALVIGAIFVLAPVRALDQTTAGVAPAPCRMVWDGETSGGDFQTAHGELQFTRSIPQADGSFVMFGSGEATVTYHSGAGFRVTQGSPFQAKLEVTLSSKDGRTAEISIDLAADETEHEIVESPGAMTFTTDAEMPPTVTVPLQDGVSTPYAETHGAGIRHHTKSGTITLHYCPSSAH